MKTIQTLILMLAAMLANQANASFIFSDVSYTDSSVTFTIDGNMTGYSTTSSSTQFSLRYLGDIWTGKTTHSTNTWLGSVFDNETLSTGGNTGGFDTCCSIATDYSWSAYSNSLFDAFATSNTVTLLLGDSYLNTAATSGGIDFVWGNGSNPGNTLFSWDVNDVTTSTAAAQVPEPAPLALFGLALLGLGLSRRRRANG